MTFVQLLGVVAVAALVLGVCTLPLLIALWRVEYPADDPQWITKTTIRTVRRK